MSIEFECGKCGALLRVPDHTAGQPTRCPECQTAATIPTVSITTGQLPAGDFAPAVEVVAAADPDNPYTSPVYAQREAMPTVDSPLRSGPAWESEGKSIGSFYRTLKQLLLAPIAGPQRWRVSGGQGAPLLFGLCGALFGWGATWLYYVVFVGLLVGAAGVQGGGEPPLIPVLLVMLGVGIVAVPVTAILSIYVSTAVIHGILLALGGGEHGFEASFRAIAYTFGAAMALWAIPVLGFYASLIGVLYVIFALMGTQNASGGKATAAVLIACGCGCGAYLSLLGMMLYFAA